MKRYIYLFSSVLIVTIIFGTIYVTTQQVLRGSLNDPQIQLAEDVKTAVDNGTIPSLDNSAKDRVDAAKSLAPFVITYSSDYRPDLSTGKLDGKIPTPPKGVFEYAAKHDRDVLTWQPAEHVRLATVVLPTKTGYVLSARNMREVEKREDQMLSLALFGWILAVGVAVLTTLALARYRTPPSSRN